MTAPTVKSKLGAFRFYILLLLLLAASSLAGFWYGNKTLEQDQKVIASLTQSVNTLNRENHTLTRQLNILSVELEVARMANLDIQNDLQDYLGVTNELRKTVSFYQQVMAPELDADGFEVYSVDIQPRKSKGYYQLNATLMQKQSKGRAVKGKLSFKISGSLNGKPYVFSPFSGQVALSPMPFSFKYFESVTQLFATPDGFVPEEIIVSASLTTSKRRASRHQQIFPWPL